MKTLRSDNQITYHILISHSHPIPASHFVWPGSLQKHVKGPDVDSRVLCDGSRDLNILSFRKDRQLPWRISIGIAPATSSVILAPLSNLIGQYKCSTIQRQLLAESFALPRCHSRLAASLGKLASFFAILLFLQSSSVLETPNPLDSIAFKGPISRYYSISAVSII